MSNALLVAFGVGLILATCGFALAKGAAPERHAALWVLGTWITGSLAQWFVGDETLPLVVLCVDGVLATALLFISIQWASLWLGAAMLVQSTAFGMHAWFLTTEPSDSHSYYATINVLGFLLVILLIASTTSRWIGRVRRRSAETARAERIAAAPLVPALT